MTNTDPDRENLIRLRKLLIDSFNLEEIQLLCFDLGLNYEELAGEAIGMKVQNLITCLQMRGRLQQLLDEVKDQRPNVSWPEFAPTNLTTEDTAAGSYPDEKTGLVMIRIPAGEFIYGEENRLEYLPEFWIAKTPVTNAQYFSFIRDTKHDPPKHWEGKSPKAEIADHPVVYVSWHDAKAFAARASMDLPTEKEWEKAARGAGGCIYPWGNEWHDGYCNTKEADIHTTTPVGQYSPQGDSPYGCVDMAGNVWEWTASWYDNKEVGRALRGGSWNAIHYDARSACRCDNHPADCNHYRGFRLVRRLPPE